MNLPGYIAVSAILAATLAAQPHTAADLGHQILAASLDPTECYHVHDIQIHQDDATFYLTDGYLIFGKPVNGAPLSAVFTTDVEGGDAEVVLLPPDRAERRTLASASGSPNLDEHFKLGVFFFTDRAARDLARQIRTNPTAEKSESIGLLLAEQWNLTVTTLMSNFEARIILDLLTKGPTGEGFFDATLRGRTLGDFDVIHDARASEQVAAGRVTAHDGVPVWDTWTRFVGTSRQGMPPPAPEQEILGYNIEVSMDATLAMHCITRMRIKARPDSRDVLPFELDSAMRILSAKVDGKPAEFYQRQSMRDGLVQNSGNELLLIVPSQPLEPGTEHEVEIVHEGKVVQNMGNELYSVSARGTWYPGRGQQFTTYETTFRYPDRLMLVSAGTVKEDHAENGIRTTRRVADGKLRLLGFNLGKYSSRTSEKNGISLTVSANHEFEPSLRRAVSAPMMVPSLTGPQTGARRAPVFMELGVLPSEPVARVDAITTELQSALDYFRTRFGDPPLRHIEVSPVPGRYGQGFAGMLYLPTLVYLDPADMPTNIHSAIDQNFYAQLLRVHEAAHQWWGNIVAVDSYHHEWLMESLANYSAAMYLETKLGPIAIEKTLDIYRAELTKTGGPDNATAESQGPVVEGRRLGSSLVPNASNAVIYGKGTWIIHMLRRRMGDERFLKMLAELRKRYEGKTFTTDEFRQLCAEFLPPGAADKQLIDFFDQWVYSTGMPTLKLTYTVVGRKLTGTITQTDAAEDFSVAVPVEIRSGAAKPVVKIVRTSGGPVKFTVDVAGPGAKAVLDPGWSVLRR